MATQSEIDQARALVPDTKLTDEQIGLIIDSSECLNEAVGKMWGQLAGGYSKLVDISEAGSSRSFGRLQDNALGMAKYYADLGCGNDVPATGVTRTRAIERL
jgi:hypothetical protein